MSAASMATSVPVPMARPTSAAASAGASLIPSPTIATVRPSACRRRTSPAFCSGSTSASTRLDADLARRSRRRSGALSPVSMTTSSAQAAQSAPIGGGRVLLDGVGDGEGPGRLAVDGGEHRGLALPRPAGRGRIQGAGADSGGGQQPGAADQDRAAVDGGLHALAGDRLEAGGGRDGQARAPRAPATIAAASGCSLSDSAAATSASSSSSSHRPAGRTSVRTGRARGDRAGLVQHHRVQLAARSPAPPPTGPGSRLGRPCRYRPWIASGVARPSAHGQAMISTAIAATSAQRERRRRPGDEPHDERRDRDADDRGHEVAGRRRRRAAGSGPGTPAPAAPVVMICASTVSAPTLVGAEPEATRWC